MISKKEDLINTYVKNKPELRGEFLSLAVKFGLIDSKYKISESSEDAVVAYWHDVTGDNLSLGCWFAYADKIKEECRELTLSDLKPRTKVEYEECNFEHAWQAVKEHEENKNIFHCNESGEYPICGYDMHTIGECVSDGEVYRKLERPVEWFDDAVDYINSLDGEATDVDRNGGVKKLYIHAEMDEREAKDFARILLGQ